MEAIFYLFKKNSIKRFLRFSICTLFAGMVLIGVNAQVGEECDSADLEDPVIECLESFTVSTDPGACTGVVFFDTPTATDNCPGVFVIQMTGPLSGEEFPVGIHLITFRAFDAMGNFADCEFEITVVDTQVPLLICPEDIVIPLSEGCCETIVEFPEPIVEDNCPGVVVEPLVVLEDGDCWPPSTYSPGYLATDQYGNIAECQYTLTIIDDTAPIITCPNDITVPLTEGSCETAVEFPAPLAEDNCPGVQVTPTSEFSSGDIFPIGTTIVEYRATDQEGNFTDCEFSVSLEDVYPPIITCPDNIVLPTDPELDGAVVEWEFPPVVDNCDYSPEIYLVSGIPSGEIFPLGTTPMVLEAMDDSENISTCSFAVHIYEPEEFDGCPDPIVVSADIAQCGAPVFYEIPLYKKLNYPEMTFSYLPMTFLSGLGSGAFFPVGTSYDMYEGEEPGDNCIVEVTVLDLEPPQIYSCSPNVYGFATLEECGSIVEFQTPDAIDNCAVTEALITQGMPSGSFFPIGVTVINFQFIDAALNAANCTFEVEVLDINEPIIDCPDDYIIPSDPGECGAYFIYPPPDVYDNCPGGILEQIGGLGSNHIFPPGTTTETFRYIDEHGNEVTCSFGVEVRDYDPPVFETCPYVTIDLTVGCSIFLYIPTPEVWDNCGVKSLTNSYTGNSNAAGVYSVGVTTITWRAEDLEGNYSTCNQYVTINDFEPPQVDCPSIQTIPNDPGLNGATVEWEYPDVTDNCDPHVEIYLEEGLPSGSLFPIGSTTMQFVAQDNTPNTTYCSYVIEVIDTEDPVINCPDPVFVETDPEQCGAIVFYGIPFGSDNTPWVVISLSSGLGNGSFFPVGTSEEVYLISDASDNSANCTIFINVLDNEPPQVNCPDDITVPADIGDCGTYIEFAIPQAIDNCEVVNELHTAGFPSGSYFPVGIIIQQYKFIDAALNETNCEFSIWVQDVEPPQIECIEDIIIPADFAECGAVVHYALPQVEDNCGVPVLTLSEGQPSGSFFLPGVNEIVFKAEDESGNSNQCNFSITVFDTDPAVMICPADIEVETDQECGDFILIPKPIVVDNCDDWTITNNVNGTDDASGLYLPGLALVEFYAEHASGESLSCGMQVQLNGPTLVEGCEVTVQLNSEGLVEIPMEIVAMCLEGSYCGDLVVVEIGKTSFSCEDVGINTIPVTWTDPLGLNAFFSMVTIIVEDITPPEMECEDVEVTIPVEESSVTIEIPPPVVWDACELSGPPVNSIDGGSELELEFTMDSSPVSLFWVAEDLDGNSASCTQYIALVQPFLNCPAPETLEAQIQSSTSVQLSWLQHPWHIDYQVAAQVQGTGRIRTKLHDSNILNVQNLKPGTTYEWTVRARCFEGSISPWAWIATFTTPAAREPEITNKLHVFPVPADLNVQAVISSPTEQDAIIRLVNVQGVLMKEMHMKLSQGDNYTDIDVSNFASGIYLIRLDLDSGSLQQRVMVAH